MTIKRIIRPLLCFLTVIACGVAGYFLAVISAMLVETGTLLTLNYGTIIKGYAGVLSVNRTGGLVGALAGLPICIPMMKDPITKGLFSVIGRGSLRGLISGGIFTSLIALYLGLVVSADIVWSFLPLGTVFIMPVWIILGLVTSSLLWFVDKF